MSLPEQHSVCQKQPTVLPQQKRDGYLFAICFSSFTLTRRAYAKELFYLSTLPKQGGHHSNNLLMTEMLDWIKIYYKLYSRRNCYLLLVQGVISVFNNSCSKRNVSDYGFGVYAFLSCSWSCDMRSGKLKSLCDFLACHHFKMNKCSWRQPAGRELMYYLDVLTL